MSINVGPEIEGKHNCELNNVVDEKFLHTLLWRKNGVTLTTMLRYTLQLYFLLVTSF